MTKEIKVPVLPESVTEATVATWHKKPGEPVKRDEHLVDIETDKVVLEVVAPADGSIEEIIKKEGDTVGGEEVIGTFKEGAASEKSDKSEKPGKSEETEKSGKIEKAEETQKAKTAIPSPPPTPTKSEEEAYVSPAARRRISEQGSKTAASSLASSSEKKPEAKTETAQQTPAFAAGEREEKRVTMTRIRAKIAERLVQSQQTAAILTTFNEINMQPVIELRQKYKDQFEKAHNARLGFMSFFVKATLEALKRFPLVNASIDGNDIVYHGYYDIGIAVSSPRGLVVPIIRNADALSMAEIETQIADFGERAKNASLSIEEMTGGTFTISNGGVFGSLMSTPIINPPQSGILGMHKIEERPIVEQGKIVIRPMMYVAMSYDHRIIDGAESVRFLATIKEFLEYPARVLLDI